MIERPRLIPAVILGAMALLALRLMAWTAEPYPGKVPSSDTAFAKAASPKPEPWALAKVIAHAHSPDIVLRDPETTGSVDKPDPAKAEAEAEAKPKPPPNPADKAAIANGTAQAMSPAERAVLEKLSARREEIEARMRDLEMRERLLGTAEKKLDGRVDELKAMEEKVEGPRGKPNEEEVKAIKNLVIMYEAMKPKDAARVFDRLGLDVLVPVVQQMNPRKMSEVLAAMAPERAEKLTVALASSGRAAHIERVVTEIATPGANELPAIAPARRR